MFQFIAKEELEKNERTQMKQLTLEISERQEEEELQVKEHPWFELWHFHLHEIMISRLIALLMDFISLRKRSNNFNEWVLVGSETNTGVPEASGHQRFPTILFSSNWFQIFSSDWFKIWMYFREHLMPTSFLGVGREPLQSESSQRIAVQRCLLLSNCICHQLRVVITTTSVKDQWYIEG